eukprot:g3767.t1
MTKFEFTRNQNGSAFFGSPMKFRAVVQRDRFEILNALTSALTKVGPTCAVLLSREELQFAVNEESQTTESLYMFATLGPQQVFSDFRVESRADNQVAFVISLELLVRALQSGRQASHVVFKLATKLGAPHLCIETTAERIDVCHDIPITLIQVDTMVEHYPPKIDDPQVQIEMAPPQSLRAVIDRMKLLDALVRVEVNAKGTMTFSVATDSVTMRTYYHDLSVTGEGAGAGAGAGADGQSQSQSQSQGGGGGGGGQGAACAVQLNSKQFVRALSYAHMQSENTVCCITQGQAMQLHVHLWGDVGDISYVIPVLNDGAADADADAAGDAPMAE